MKRALLLLLLPGCAWISAALGGELKLPTLSFETVRVSNWSLTSVQLDTVWEVDNPNDLRLELVDVDYELFVEGKRVATGRPPEGVVLPGGETVKVVLPAEVRFADILDAAPEITGKQKLRYRASGSAGIDTPTGVVRRPLSHTGTVDVPDLSKLAP